MAIFPIIETESVIQVGDKVRIDASKSFTSKDEDPIHEVEIMPEAGGDWVSVYVANNPSAWFLDWSYAGSSRTVTVSCRIRVDGAMGPTQVVTKTISVVSAADDKLFSADSDLTALEPDVLKWVKSGRSSFLDVHRMAQSKIIEWMDEAGYRNEDGSKVSKNELLDLSEVRPWSRDLTLSLIFFGISNQVDDVFSQKSKFYSSQAKDRADRAVLAWDFNKDGSVDAVEEIAVTQSMVMER
jgi:hypothetical protein